jgi:hypothetical protein
MKSVLASVGYGKIVQDPKRIIESVGFKKALREMGLTEELITMSLVDDIKAKPERRVQEIKLGAEILGMVKREDEPVKATTSNTYNFLFSSETRERVQQLDAEIKANLIKQHVQPNKESDTPE